MVTKFSEETCCPYLHNRRSRNCSVHLQDLTVSPVKKDHIQSECTAPCQILTPVSPSSLHIVTCTLFFVQLGAEFYREVHCSLQLQAMWGFIVAKETLELGLFRTLWFPLSVSLHQCFTFIPYKSGYRRWVQSGLCQKLVRGSSGIAPYILNSTSHYMYVSGQLHVPAAL